MGEYKSLDENPDELDIIQAMNVTKVAFASYTECTLGRVFDRSSQLSKVPHIQ